MTTFKVGEVAIIQNSSDLKNNGLEVVITSPLKIIIGIDQYGHPIRGQGHSVDGDGFNAALLFQLRKRRPPSTDEAAAQQAMLDCIQKAKMPIKERV